MSPGLGGRAMIVLTCIVAGCAGGAVGAVVGGAAGLEQSILLLSIENLNGSLNIGAVAGLFTGLLVGLLSQARFESTGRRRLLWTSPLHSLALSFLFILPLIYFAAASAGC